MAGKRANGEGSVFRRADGQWTAEVSFRDEMGARKRRTVYGATQTEARAKQRVLRQQLDGGAPIRSNPTTLATWIDTWVANSLPASDRKQATINLYSTVVRKHLAPALGRKRLDNLRPADVKALIVAKRAAGLAPSTVRTIYTVLRAALDIAVRDGLLRTNPASVVQRPGVDRRDAAFLSVDEAHRLLETMRGERLEPLFRLLLATGLRRGEALGLHWSDINLRTASLRVRWTLTRTSKGLQLGEPKTEKSRRTIPIPGAAVALLKVHRTKQESEKQEAGETWHESGLVFTTEVGTALEPRNVLRRFDTLAKRAGLQNIHLHSLRHSTASFLLAAGTHTKVVQEHLGHSSYAITADIYSHMAPEQRREAADRLDSALDW